MEDNVIQFSKKSKAERYKVWLGSLDQSDRVLEEEQAGYAFQKPGSTSFRLKLWMFLNQSYYVIPTKGDQTRYNLYSLDEYISENKELKTFWNKVGEADLLGNYLRLKFNLLERHLYLSLFDDNESSLMAQAMDAA